MEELLSSEEPHYDSMASHFLLYCPVGVVFLPIYLNYVILLLYDDKMEFLFLKGCERTIVFITSQPDICYCRQQYPKGKSYFSNGCFFITQGDLKEQSVMFH